MAEPISIGGRRFVKVGPDMSFAQHAYLMREVVNAGLHANRGDGEAYLQRVLGSGRVTQLLAGALTEEGKDWSEESANQNALFFGAVKGSENVNALQQVLFELVADFFVSAGLYEAISGTSSTTDAELGAAENKEQSTSENSEPSSESSPEEIPPGSAPS